MEEEALKDAHSLFTKTGYKGDINDFKNLVSTNKEALNDSHKLFVKTGYKGDVNKFSELIGVKKKDSSVSSGQETQKESQSVPKGRTSLLALGKTKKAEGSDSSTGKIYGRSIDDFKIKEKPLAEQTSEEVKSKGLKSVIGLTEKTSSASPVSINQPLKRQVKDSLGFQKKKKTYNFGEDINVVRDQVQNADFKTIQEFDEKGIMFPKDVSEQGNFITANKNVFDKVLEESYQTGLMKIKDSQLTDRDFASIDDEYNKVSKGEDWLERIGTTAKSAWDYISSNVSMNPKDFEIKKPLYKERQEVLNEAFKNKKVLTSAQIEEKVKEKFYSNRIKEIQASKRNEVNSNLTDAEQYAITKNNGVQRKNLTIEEKQEQDGINDLIQTTKLFADERTELLNKYKGVDAPQEVVDRFDFLTKNININAKLIPDAYDRLNNAKKKLSKFEEEKDYYNKEQETFKDLNKRFSSSLMGLTAGTLQFASKYIAPSIPGPLGDTASMASSQLAQLAKEKQEEISSGLRTTNTIESVSDLIRYTEETLGNNTVATVALLAGGAPGMYALAASTAGEKSLELEKDKSLSELQKTAIPLLWGSTMLLPLASQLKTLRGASRIIGAAEAETDNAITKSLSKKIWSGIKTNTGQTLKLGTELKAMTFAQGALDYSMGKDVDFYKIASDLKPYREAIVLHGLNKVAASTMSSVSDPFIDVKERFALKSNSEVLKSLHEALNAPEITPQEAGVIRSQIDRVAKESGDIVDSVIDKMSKMSDADYSKTLDLHRRVNELAKEAFQVRHSETMEEGVKRLALDKLKKEMSKSVKDLNTHLAEFTPMEKPFEVSKDEVAESVSEEGSKKVENLRSQEQTELKEALPNAELNSEGKVDSSKLSSSDKKVYDDIYNKYDKLISPLLEKGTEVTVEPAKESITKEEVVKENKTEETKKVSDDYVSLSDEIKTKDAEIKSIEDKIARSKSENRKAKMEEAKSELEKQREELESKKQENIKSDDKMKFIHENMDKLIKELEKAEKLKKEPCNL